MRKIPISGGPHAGKTTLLNALRAEYPDAYFVPEPAERVITRELEKQAQTPDYTPVVPWIDYSLFGPAVANESVVLESIIPASAELVFQDRSLIDTIGYCRLNGLESFIPDVKRRIDLANYAFAIFCEPVGNYGQTEIRRETREEAERTHDYLLRSYQESGIEIIHLPAVATVNRLNIICEHIPIV